MIDASQLRNCVVIPVLESLGLNSDSAVELLLGTAAHESHMGTYLVQVGGPALGIFQMEPDTYNDIWDNYLAYRPELAEKAKLYSAFDGMADEMVWNMAYACAMARIHYRRVPEALPPADDLYALAAYYKKYYNTMHGAATELDFVDAYKKYVRDG